ncbi:MAG TPA: alpha/beta fold hydrolase [Gemmataceae bacterium]|nr:alpha/beta fold hydrolase [Gemmataceae bacterium]
MSLLALLVESVISLVAHATGRSSRWALRLRAAILLLLVINLPYWVTIHPLHTVPKRTPAAFGLAFEEVRFRTADGVELGGWLIPHSNAKGNVIVCHGHGRNRGHVAGFLPTLHGLGLNVLAFDFRGHGESAGHTCTFGHREVRDLLAAEAYVRERFPGKPLVLVGVSLGAAVALQALPRLPGVCGVWSEGCFSRLGNAVDRQFAFLPGWLRRPLVAGYNDLGWLDCGFWAPDINPIEVLARTDVPICFCHGRADELVPLCGGKGPVRRLPWSQGPLLGGEWEPLQPGPAGPGEIPAPAAELSGGLSVGSAALNGGVGFHLVGFEKLPDDDEPLNQLTDTLGVL